MEAEKENHPITRAGLQILSTNEIFDLRNWYVTESLYRKINVVPVFELKFFIRLESVEVFDEGEVEFFALERRLGQDDLQRLLAFLFSPFLGLCFIRCLYFLSLYIALFYL